MQPHLLLFVQTPWIERWVGLPPPGFHPPLPAELPSAPDSFQLGRGAKATELFFPFGQRRSNSSLKRCCLRTLEEERERAAVAPSLAPGWETGNLWGVPIKYRATYTASFGYNGNAGKEGGEVKILENVRALQSLVWFISFMLVEIFVLLGVGNLPCFQHP